MSGQLQVTTPTSSSIWSWAFEQENAAAVAGWGFWLAIAGLVLTLVGFWITLKQLSKTKSATEAATDEVQRIRGSLDAYDATHEASRAQYALKTTRRYLNNKLWSEVLISYDDVRKSLMIIRATASDKTADHADRIDVAVKYIEKLCQRIEADMSKEISSINEVKTYAVIRQHEELLIDINIALQRSLI